MLEAAVNTTAGFVIFSLIAYFIPPYWSFYRNIVNSVEVTAIFTVVSVFRNFFVITIFQKILDRNRYYV